MSVPPQPRRSPDGRSGQSQSPWAATGRTGGERVTSRLRKIADELPDWEPLPPGETFVRRPGSSA
ncbi:hypothetical protein [Streptomyces sp. NPDC055189]